MGYFEGLTPNGIGYIWGLKPKRERMLRGFTPNFYDFLKTRESRRAEARKSTPHIMNGSGFDAP